MRHNTGVPRVDAEYDFLRVRRRQILARLGNWLRGKPRNATLLPPPQTWSPRLTRSRSARECR